MLIKVTEVGDVEAIRKGKNKWNQVTIKYNDEKGGNKEFSRTIVDFKDKEVFDAACEVEVDKFYEVDIKKEGDYWNWKSIEPSDATSFGGGGKSSGAAPASKGGGNGGADWGAKNALDRERFEFDKEKQGLIVRQSCLGYAVETLGHGAKLQEVIALATKYEQWVWEANDVDPGMSIGGGSSDMPD
jgi:hypothetical protein